MMASLYPTPLRRRRGDRPGRHRRRSPTAARSGSPAARRSGSASPSRSSATPALLVLDEPTVAMDVESRHAFWDTMRGFAARGKTIVFATHYLEEADANADRAVLMAHGSIVADGPTTEIKAMVGPAHDPRDAARCGRRRPRGACPGVNSAERRGEAIVLHCADSDAAIRALLAAYPDVARHRDHRRRARAGVPPAHGGRAGVITYAKYEIVRTFRNRRFFIFSIGFPVVLYFRSPARTATSSDFADSGLPAAALLHGRADRVRHDEHRALDRHAHRRRAGGRLEPAAAPDAALDP